MTYISKTRRATGLKFCIRNAFMSIMTHTKFHFNRLMLTFDFWNLIGLILFLPGGGGGEGGRLLTHPQ